MDAIYQRRSIRKYLDQMVSDEHIHGLLRAAMYAPSAGDERPWHFVVVKNRETLEAITKIHPYTQMLKEAPLAIIVCADTQIAKYDGDFWVQDTSAAVQNILLEATDLGLGSCWCGLYPKKVLTEPVKKLLQLPEQVEPVAIIAVGHPAQQRETAERFDSTRVHYEVF